MYLFSLIINNNAIFVILSLFSAPLRAIIYLTAMRVKKTNSSDSLKNKQKFKYNIQKRKQWFSMSAFVLVLFISVFCIHNSYLKTSTFIIYIGCKEIAPRF